jgi:hypothetical protein
LAAAEATLAARVISDNAQTKVNEEEGEVAMALQDLVLAQNEEEAPITKKRTWEHNDTPPQKKNLHE